MLHRLTKSLIILLLIVGCSTEPEYGAGVEDGDSILDECGICDSDSSNDCIQDCKGVWGGNADIDECGVCDGNGYTVSKLFNLEFAIIERKVTSNSLIVHGNVNYIGTTINEAKKRIKQNKLIFDERNIFYYYDDLDFVDIISKQHPKEGSIVLESSSISFWVCAGKPPNEYVVPNVVGMGINEGIKELKINGFLIGDISYIIKNNFLENTVYELSYISKDGYSIEVLEGVKYTVPMTLNVLLTKYGE